MVLTTHTLEGKKSKWKAFWEESKHRRRLELVDMTMCRKSQGYGGDVLGSTLVSTVTQSRTQTPPKALGSICLYWVHLKISQNHIRNQEKNYIGGS